MPLKDNQYYEESVHFKRSLVAKWIRFLIYTLEIVSPILHLLIYLVSINSLHREFTLNKKIQPIIFIFGTLFVSYEDTYFPESE